jgi:hypothetical protein
MAETPKGFGQRLRDLRKSKNLAQTEPGHLAGLYYTHIGRFEDRAQLKQFQEVGQLPDEDKNGVKKLIDAFLTRKQNQALAR